MTRLRAAVLAALTFLTGLPAGAEPVTLRARDGSLAVTGDFLGFDGDFYRIRTAAGAVTVDAARVTCDGAACPDPASFIPEIRLSGARSLSEVLVPALLESYAARADLALAREALPERGFRYTLSTRGDGAAARVVARFRFLPSSSGEAFADLVADEADIALSTREPTAEEIEIARSAGLGELTAPGRSRILGLDALVPLVSVANPVTGIGMEQLAEVFAGRIASWADLGGPDAPIALHLRGGSAGLTQDFNARVMAPRAAVPAPGITRHDSDDALAGAVADDPLALGIGSYARQGNAGMLALSGSCGFRSDASDLALMTEDYPLTAPLFLYLPNYRLAAPGRDFLAYATSPAAQPVIRRAGFVDQFPRAIPLAAQGRRLANAILAAGEETGLSDLQRMVRALAPLSRLTVTFRFEDGSALLDAQSRSNVALLARALARGLFEGRRLVFAGFSDGVGPAADNRRLSRLRAEAVRDAVRGAMEAAGGAAAAGRLRLDVAAYGEALPLGCDAEDWGRRLNRRVEVWLDQSEAAQR